MDIRPHFGGTFTVLKQQMGQSTNTYTDMITDHLCSEGYAGFEYNEDDRYIRVFVQPTDDQKAASFLATLGTFFAWKPGTRADLDFKVQSELLVMEHQVGQMKFPQHQDLSMALTDIEQSNPFYFRPTGTHTTGSGSDTTGH